MHEKQRFLEKTLHLEDGQCINSIEMVYEFLKENSNKGFECVNLHGGEPTLLDEFIDIIKMIKELGYPAISVQTNGRKLSEMDFAKDVVNNGVTLGVISLHGHTK